VNLFHIDQDAVQGAAAEFTSDHGFVGSD